MNIPAILTIIVFLLYSGGATYFYVCEVKQACDEHIVGDHESIIRSVIDYPVAFKYNSLDPLKGNRFEESKNSLLSQLGTDNLLEIVGWYDPDEINTSIYANVGIARAKSIRSLYPEISEHRISYLSETREFDPKAAFFEASRLNIVINTFDKDSTFNDSTYHPVGWSPDRVKKFKSP